ncbi:calcium-binding protein, partial [uncultured Pseudacidovorax sp.]|uniref:calcium-binding protein n=1 Tax=uncultured Pseudacidovorax sp. TaxID=679313 RepID=UPI0025E1E154
QSNAVGLSLTNAQFGLALMSQHMAAGSTTPARTWTSLQATATSAQIVGVDGLTLSAGSIAVAVNKAGTASDAVVEYTGANKTTLAVATGTGTSIDLSLDGSKGALTQASAHLTLDVFGFAQLSGDFAFEKSSNKTVTLANAAHEQVTADVLTIGGTNINAFIGANGGQSNAVGLSLTNAQFGLALMSQHMAAGSTTPARTWTSLQATATSAQIVGVDGLTLSAGAIAIAVNQAGTANDAVVEYTGANKTSLSVATGTGTSLDLSLDGSKGKLMQASAHLTLDVFGFAQLSGDFAFEKSSSKTVTLSDRSTATVDVLTIGGTGIDGFVGASGTGVQLNNVQFGLALMGEKMAAGSTAPARNWTSVQAKAGSVAFVGISDVTLRATDLELLVNQSGQAGAGANVVVDYAHGTQLAVATGTGTTPLQLSMDGAKGKLLQASGHLTVDVYGFFHVEGDLAIQKSSRQVTLAAHGSTPAATVDVDMLTIGGADLEAFAGVGGGTASASGLQLHDVDFGLALMTQRAASGQAATGRSWTSLQASAGSAGFVGLGDINLSASGLKVLINQASVVNDAVVDYASGATDLTVVTGGAPIHLDMAGAKGELLQASAHLSLDLYGFFQVEGDFALQTSSQTVKLSDSTTANVDLLTLGASGVDAFAGLNGGTANQMGLKLSNVTFGLALMHEHGGTRSWTSLQATAGGAAIVGAGDLTVSASNIAVAINQSGSSTSVANATVVDYAAGATQLAIATGGSSTLALDMKGSDGALMKASAQLVVDLYGFVQVSGDFAIQTSTATVQLADASRVNVNLLTIGASNVHAFAGVNGGTSDALGVELDGVDVALALMTSQADATRHWTALQASAAGARFLGIDALTIAATDVALTINRAGLAGQSVIDFKASPLRVDIGGSRSVLLDMDGSRGNTTAVQIGRATLGISDYIYISGGFYFEQLATTHVDVATGLPAGNLPASLASGLARVQGLSADHKRIEDLEVSALLLSGSNLEVFAGLGPYFIDANHNGIRDAGEQLNPDAFGVKLDRIDVGLAMFDSTLAADPLSVIPKLYALQVRYNNSIDIDLGGVFRFAADGLSIDVNQGGKWGTTATGVLNPYVDFSTSFNGGFSIPTSGAPIAIDYSRAMIGVNIDHALLNIGGFFQIEGGFAFERTTTLVDVNTGLDRLQAATLGLGRLANGMLSTDGSRITGLAVNAITIGASNVVIKVGDTSDPLFTLPGIDVAFAAFKDTHGVVPLMYSLKASWAKPVDADWGFMQLQVQGLELQLNSGSNWSSAVKVAPTIDFVSSFRSTGGFEVATGGAPVKFDFSGAYFGVQVQHALISIGDFFHVEGGFSIGRAGSVGVDIVTGLNAVQARTLGLTSGTISADGSRIDNYAMNVTTIGLSNVKMFVGAGPYFIDTNNDGVSDSRSGDATGLVIDNFNMALAMFTDPTKKVGTLWALSASVDNVAFVGLESFLTLSAEGAQVRANSGAAWSSAPSIKPYVDFVSTFGAGGLLVQTGNAPIALAFTNGYIGVDVARATIVVQNFVHIQGGFSFEMGRRQSFRVDTGATLTSLAAGSVAQVLASGGKVSSDFTHIDDVEMQMMTIGVSQANVFVGYGTPDFQSTTPIRDQDGVFGVAVKNIDLALAILTPTGRLAKVMPKFIAVDGSADEFIVAGGADIFELSSGRIDVQMNWSTGWSTDPASRPSIDFAHSAQPLKVRAGATELTIDYAGGAFVQATVHDVLLTVSKFVYVSGDFAFRMSGATSLDVKTVGNVVIPNVQANAIEIGASNVTAFVGVNKPFVSDTNGDGKINSADALNPESVGLLIRDFDFGMTILTAKNAIDPSNPLSALAAGAKFVGMKAHGEQIGFVGFGSDFIQFDLQDVNVGINISNRTGLIADFSNGGKGREIATGGAPMVIDYGNAILEASVGKATASIAGILALQGGFTFQKRTLDEVEFHGPGFGLGMPAEALVVAGKNVSAFAGINGHIQADGSISSGAIGLAVTGLDFALAMLSPSLGANMPAAGPAKFFALDAKADFAGLVGTDPWLTLNATDLRFAFNGAFAGQYPLPGFYADLSKIDGGKGLEVPIGTTDKLVLGFSGNTLGIGMTAHLGIMDLIKIDAGFNFNFTLPDTGNLFPKISLSGLGDMLPTLSPNFDFLKGAISFIRDLDISIGFDGKLPTIMGTLKLPNLSLDLGDFVHLRGDFQLNIGETFTGKMYTGLPADLASVESLLNGTPAAAVIDGLKALGGVSGDYSTIDGVTFKGLSFGASNVYAYVGVGNPHYEAVTGQPGKLRITNPNDLVGFSVEGVDVGFSMFKADLPQFFNAQNFFSLYVHADKATTYGMGDVLKVRAEDVTIEVNYGGLLFGGLLKSTANFSSIVDPVTNQHGFKVRTGPSTGVYLNFEGTQLLGVDIGYAELQVSQFLSLSGSLAFRKGDRFMADVNLGALQKLMNEAGTLLGTSSTLKLQMETITLAGHDLQGFAGVGGPYRYDSATDNNDRIDNNDPTNEGAIGIAIGNVDFAVVISTPALMTLLPQLEQVSPRFLTVKADVGYAQLVGIPDSILSAQLHDVSVNINTFVLPEDPTGGYLNLALQLIGPPSINWETSFPVDAKAPAGTKPGFQVQAGGGHTILIDFNEELIQASIGYAEINIGGFLQLSASMALTKKGSEAVTLTNGVQTNVSSLALGISQAYGFVGYGGYWRDSDNDGRITPKDSPNTSAVGLAVKNLNLGLVVSRELEVGLTSVSVGAYVAGHATIDSIDLVGVTGADMTADLLSMEINLGARATFSIGKLSGDIHTGVSFTEDVSASFQFAAIDYSKASYRDVNGVVQPGYAIATGDAAHPIVLNYDEQLLRIKGRVELNLFGLVTATGVLDFRFSQSTGLTAFADVMVQIGPDGLNLKRHGTGLIVVQGGSDPGVAARLSLDANLTLGSVVDIRADLDLSLNTFGRDITYVVPDEFRALTGFDSFTIGAAPPGKPGWVGPYAAVVGHGTMDLLDHALSLKGDFSVIVSVVDGTVRAELGATATLDLPLLQPLSVTGTLGILIDPNTPANTGIYGAFEVGGSGPNSTLIDGGGIFTVTGKFLLQINTTATQQEVRTLALDSHGNPLRTVMLSPQMLRISGSASVAVGPVSMSGAMDLLIDARGVQAAMDMTMELAGFGQVKVGGSAAFLMEGGSPVFALNLHTNVELGAGPVTIRAGADIRINTGSSDYTDLHGNVVKANTLFDMQLVGTIKLLTFNVDFKGGISVIDNVFKLSFDGSLNFFNALTIDVGGYVDSEGNFEIRGKAEIDIHLGPLHLNAGVSLTLSSAPRFAAAAWGSLDFEIDLGLFSIDFTLAGFRGEIDINAASAYMAARVTVMGITLSGSFKWSWADPPRIAYQVGDTLYLNMGDTSNRYGNTVYDDIIGEAYTVEQEKDSNVVTVSSLGESASFTNVNHIVANGGRGNDSIYVGRHVRAQLQFDGGEGNDSFVILGGGAGSVVRGGAGNDQFASGDVGGIRFEGGAGNDRFVGGDGADIVDMGDGVNTIKSGGGNDVIYVGAGTNNVETGTGNNTIYVTGPGTLNLKSGSDYDRLVLSAFSSSTPLVLGDHQLATTINGGDRVINFDDALDRIEVTDTASTGTALKMTGGASWGKTSLHLSSAGVVDVTQATLLKLPEAMLSIDAAGLRGTLTTQVDQLNVVNRGTAGAGFSDIVVRELDGLSIVADGYAAGGLTTPNGLMDIQLATHEAALTLASGQLSTGTGGGSIAIVADDVDFASGDDHVSGTGALSIRTWSIGQSYRIGAAAQGLFGGDYSFGIETGYLELGMRDLSALKDGFSGITIGHRAAGVAMYVGDVEDATIGTEHYSAMLRDGATLIADRIDIVGDVQSTDRLSFQARLMDVQRQNLRTPMGAPDSGVHARETVVRLTEQLLVSGWLTADTLVDVRVAGTTGQGAMVSYGAEANSITTDKGAVIRNLTDGGQVLMAGSGSVVMAASVQALGAGARMELSAGTSFKLLEGAVLSAEGANSTIDLRATGAMGLLSGSAVLSGARYAADGLTPLLVGGGATLSITTAGELMLSGALVAAGALRIDAGAVSDPHADYFDTLPGKTLASTSDAGKFAAIVSALNQGQIHVDLRSLFGAGNTPLASVASAVSLANYTPFDALSDAAKATLVASLGYTTYDQGGYWNAATHTFRTALTEGELVAYRNADIHWGDAGAPAANAGFDQLTLAQKKAVATQLGYATYDGLVFTRTAADGTMAVVTGFTQGPAYDYDNARIGWAAAGVSAPAAGTAFDALSGAQKMVVAEALGYTFDFYSMPGDLWFGPGVDAGTPIAPIPDADAAWSQLSAQQRQIVADFLDHGTGYKNFFNYNAAPGKKAVSTFTQGPASDYANGSIYWGSAGAPAAGAAFGDLTAAQQKVVARAMGYEVLEGLHFIKTDAAKNVRVVDGFAQGQAADYNLDAIDWGGVARPADSASFEDLNPSQRAVVLKSLGYDQVDRQVFYNAGTGRVLGTLVEGDGKDYSNADIAWGNLTRPATGQGFEQLGIEQQNAVLAQLGYARWDGAVYYNATKPVGEQYHLSFKAGTDYTVSGLRWADVARPADHAALSSLTGDQLFRVLDQSGFTSYGGKVYYNAAAPAGKQLMTSFTEGIDYRNADVTVADTNRWVVSDGSHQYVVYAYDANNDGAVDEIRVLEPHPLLGQRGFGFLLTGTITTLQDDADFVVSTADDVIVRGNINLLGAGSDLVMQSDRWLYWEGQANVNGNITLVGGVELDGTDRNGANAAGTSVYVNASSTLNTTRAGSSITVIGSQDVELHGAIVAGGTIGAQGVTWSGPDSTIVVKAGQQVLVDAGLQAAKSVTLTTTKALSADDQGWAVVIGSAGGLNAAGLTSDQSGGLVSVDAQGGVTIAGSILSGATMRQTFDANGRLLSEDLDWSAGNGTVRLHSLGQLYLGGQAKTASGGSIEVGATIRASHLVDLAGGFSLADGIGVKMPAAARVTTQHADGEIRVSASQDAEILGQLVAGGQVVDHRDADGFTLGSTAQSFGGDSVITIVAGQQVRLGRDLTAGKTIDVRGGTGTGTATQAEPWLADGIVVGGAVHLRTTQQDSTLSLSAAGSLSVLTPEWTQELVAADFMQYASGRITQDVAFTLSVQDGSRTVSQVVRLAASATTGNTGIAGLAADLQAAIDAIPDFATYGLKVRLADGHLMLTSGAYRFAVAAVAGGHAELLGFTQVDGGATASSGRAYALDASARGSVVNLGRANAPGGDITISGAIRGHSAINMFAGTNALGNQNVHLSATSLLETLSGGMQLSPAGNVVMEGDLIARGLNADIVIDARQTLEIRGELTAQRDIVIKAGTQVHAGEVSLRTTGTAQFNTLDAGGRIVMTGLNDVSINSSIGRGNAAQGLVQIGATSGTLTLEHASGWIETGAQIVLSGKNVDLAGVVKSTGATPASYDYEVEVSAAQNVQLHADMSLAGSLRVVAGGNIAIYGSPVAANAAGQGVTLSAGGDVSVGSVGSRSGGAVLSADRLVDIHAGGNLRVASDGKVLALGAGSLVRADAVR